jgi:hypothetical protein
MISVLPYLRGLFQDLKDTFAIGMHYDVYKHQDSPYQYVLGSMIVIQNVLLTTFVTFKIVL